MKTRKSDTTKAPPPRERRPEMRAPRPGNFEPIPLQIPLEPPHHERSRAKDPSTPRGVVIIQYGDDET